MTPIVLKTYNQYQGHRFVNPVLGTRTSVNFVANFLKSKRLIYFGEIHSIPNIVKFQETILDFLVGQVREENEKRFVDDGEGKDGAKVVVIMEHFAGAQHQSLLDKFMQERRDGSEEEMSFESFLQSYDEGGEEGHNLEPYWSLLSYARKNADVVEIKAGFIPRFYAKLLMAKGSEEGLETAYNDGFLNRDIPYMTGSESHYNFFESLISGREMTQLPPGDRFRKIFPAQIIKDSAMAHIVIKEVQASEKNRILVICGAGHCEYRFGVPERVDAAAVMPKDQSCVISTRHVDHYEIDWKSDELNATDDDVPLVLGREGPFENVEEFETKHPADLIYFYEDEENDLDESARANYDSEGKTEAVEAASKDNAHAPSSNPDQIKSEIADAYNQVGQTAHIEGDSKLAATVMTFLEYTDEQIRIAGRDAFNYQGVGNPHKHASIKVGDRVLDLGSGLGVDSFIAASRVGDEGSVVGLDISKGEVVHASKRARARGVEERVTFVNGDMENVPLPDDSVDVVISNGAFCLAPDKERAFQEIYRVLKPGGHFSVACTTLLKDLDGDVNWPICMRVFMPLVRAQPMLDHIGFEAVEVDASNSLMTYTLEVEEEEQVANEAIAAAETERQNRKKIHVGSDDFKHLEDFDMNELCARVILHGRKP